MTYVKHKVIKPHVVKSSPMALPAAEQPFYDRPVTAVDIWFDGQSIVLGFPPNADSVRGHTVKIPIEKCQLDTTQFGDTPTKHRGWKALLDCLRARHDAASHVKIASRGAETRYQMEQILLGMKATKYDDKNQRITTLEDLGL